MNGLLVRAGGGDLSVTFQLSAFITDWGAAKKAFVACIAEGFRELLSPRPGDFSAASTAELGEAWCKYRIFGGVSTIVLRADSLELAFPNISNADRPIVVEVVQGAMEDLLPALEVYERHSYRVAFNHHADVTDGCLDTYLAQHGSDHLEGAIRGEPAIEYRPSIGFRLRSSDGDGDRVLRRFIEKSDVLPYGLFVADYILVSIPNLTKFEEELSWIEQTLSFADDAAGIAYQKEEVDGAAGP